MILIAYGTRPEYIKIKPIIDRLDVEYRLVFTGQHKDIAPDEADYTLEIQDGSNRLDSVVCSCLNNEEIFQDVEYILVQGDTSSVMALALAAFHREVKVIHLEAGLRSGDNANPYPEEVNRQIVSSIASIHLCPTQQNAENLKQEKRQGQVYVVGNTVLDNINKENCTYGDLVVVTLHRRENHHWLGSFFEELNNLAKSHPELDFVLPIHPNPNVQKHRNILTHVNVIDPVSRDKMLEMLKECRFAISDSGGLQEECSYLNKKIIVCRKVTERPETIGTHSFMCVDPNKLAELFQKINTDYEVDAPCPYGDGTSTEKIIKILNKL